MQGMQHAGLTGFIFGFIAFGVSVLALLVTGLYVLIAKHPDMRFLYAALTAFLVMCGYFYFVYAEDKNWLQFPNAYYDWIGPLWILAAVLLSLWVYYASGVK